MDNTHKSKNKILNKVKKTNIIGKKKKNNKYIKEIKNLCVECGIDMGPENPRQLCYKTYCPNINYDNHDNYDCCKKSIINSGTCSFILIPIDPLGL